MTNRIDFSPPTKAILAARSGYKCCYLGCGQATSGPSRDKNNTAISNTGEAAHIYSATNSPRAKRNPPKDMSIAEIKSAGNGIWMCRTHAKYIDDDQTTFTPQHLQDWKKFGEKIAGSMQESNVSYIAALNRLITNDKKVRISYDFAIEHDPFTKNNNLDKNVYEKILHLIPDHIRRNIRNAAYIYNHPSSERDILNKYFHESTDNPIESSFIDVNLQKLKSDFDDALVDLLNTLATVTFYNPGGIRDGYYSLEPTWKLTTKGEKLYTDAVQAITNKCELAIRKFDALHKDCREKFND